MTPADEVAEHRLSEVEARMQAQEDRIRAVDARVSVIAREADHDISLVHLALAMLMALCAGSLVMAFAGLMT